MIEINNKITRSNGIILRKLNVKPYKFDKVCMGKDLIEGKLYQIMDQFSERKITPIKFYSILPNQIRLYFHRNDRACEILFGNDDKMIKLIDETKN